MADVVCYLQAVVVAAAYDETFAPPGGSLSTLVNISAQSRIGVSQDPLYARLRVLRALEPPKDDQLSSKGVVTPHQDPHALMLASLASLYSVVYRHR